MLLREMTGIAMALVLAAVLGAGFYWLRRLTVRTPEQMRRFLDRRFDVIRRKGFWGEQREWIDEAMIKRWGNSGLFPIPLASLNLSQGIDQLWSLGGLSAGLLLLFAAMLFGDSRAAVHFMRSLGIARYPEETALGG